MIINLISGVEKMVYKEDRDLEFLQYISSEDLKDLVYCLTRDKDGDLRITEELTTTAEYKKFYPDHHKYWWLIAAEIQTFGANTIATMFRGGEGVLYKEVLTDVCDKLKVKYNRNSSVERIENCLLMKILEDALEKMKPEELKELAIEAGLKNTEDITPQAMIIAFQGIFKAGGFASYQLTVIVANAVFKALFGRGLSLAANAALTRTMAILTGPIGWIITILWSIIDIAGPAYRVTIPAVLIVAALRQKYLYGKEKETSK